MPQLRVPSSLRDGDTNDTAMFALIGAGPGNEKIWLVEPVGSLSKRRLVAIRTAVHTTMEHRLYEETPVFHPKKDYPLVW